MLKVFSSLNDSGACVAEDHRVTLWYRVQIVGLPVLSVLLSGVLPLSPLKGIPFSGACSGLIQATN